MNLASVTSEDGASADMPAVPRGETGLPATASTAAPETATGNFEPDRHDVNAQAEGHAVSGFVHLRVLADTLDDIMRTRIAVTNRVTFASIDGFSVAQHLGGLADTEAKLKLALRRQFRVAAPTIRAWTVDTVGLGEPIMARFIGAVGDPLIAQPYVWSEAPDVGHVCGANCGENRHLVALEPYRRSPRQFLSYCGWGDPARRRRVGMSAADAASLGNQRAKPLAYVLAESCIRQQGNKSGGTPMNRASAEQVTAPPIIGEVPENRSSAKQTSVPAHGGPSEQSTTAEVVPADHHLSIGDGPEQGSMAQHGAGRRRSPYRDVYDLGRARYAEREWTLGHQHQAAIRLTVKAILLDVWRVSAGFEPHWPQL